MLNWSLNLDLDDVEKAISLCELLINQLYPEYYVPTIRHSSALFLIKEFDILGAQTRVWRLGWLILDRLVVRLKTCGGL